MNKSDKNLWQGISEKAQSALGTRDYSSGTFAEQLAGKGVEARKLAAADRNDRRTGKGLDSRRRNFFA